MRLLDTQTIELSEFFDADIPPYAILSHTWGKNEVTFQKFDRARAEGSASYDKIARCCTLASSRGYQWVRIDTCCIDKSSSAELSEAINSMFRWYRNSKECYVYLEDVSIDDMDQLGSSRWFTRGWTLQELLAPKRLYFYDKHWRNLGSRQSLCKAIALATNIPVRSLDIFTYHGLSVAARMSWASKRQTSRIEDTAYCLMGLFNVNMPLLYGEGLKAFTRLQHEIVKNSDDESIFAWTSDNKILGGMFAESPADFADSGDVEINLFKFFHRPEPNTVTSRGLSMQLVGKIESDLQFGHKPDTEWVPLHCSRGVNGNPLMFRILVRDDSIFTCERFAGHFMELDQSKLLSREIKKVYIGTGIQEMFE